MRRCRGGLGAAIIAVACLLGSPRSVAAALGCGGAQPREPRAYAVLRAHAAELSALPGVDHLGTRRTGQSDYEIVLFVTTKDAAQLAALPTNIESIRVATEY